MSGPTKCTATEECVMRRKIALTPFNIPEEFCGVKDSEVADIATFTTSPLGRPMVIFNFCPWCGAKWHPMGKTHEMVRPPAPDEESGEEWKKGGGKL